MGVLQCYIVTLVKRQHVMSQRRWRIAEWYSKT